MDWRSVAHTVSADGTSFGRPDTSVLPHIFTGTVTLNGTSAPDGTRVAATMARASDSVVAIEVTATDDNGNTATAFREFVVNHPGVEVISGVTASGTFILLVEQPLGESFGGRDIRFTVGGQEAAQSGTWERGGATELNLSAGTGR